MDPLQKVILLYSKKKEHIMHFQERSIPPDQRCIGSLGAK